MGHESYVRSKQQNPVAQHFANEEIDSQQYYIGILEQKKRIRINHYI